MRNEIAFCPDCGSPVGEAAIFCARCGYSIARRATPVRYAAFPQRVAATLIDLALLFIPAQILFALIGKVPNPAYMSMAHRALRGEIIPDPLIMQMQMDLATSMGFQMLSVFVVGWLYFTVTESSPLQGTIGKLLLRLKVTDLDGRRIKFGRANLRYFGRWISAIPSCLGYLMPLFTEKKQALHDIIAGALVLRK